MASYDQLEAAKRTATRGASGLNATMLMIGVIMGTGVMGLPAATARLGWIIGISAILAFGVFSNYSALLLAHTRNVHYPHVSSLSELATEVVGPRFGKLTSVLIVCNWGSLLPYYLMAAVSAIESTMQVLDIGLHLCYWQWALMLMAILILPLQLKTLTSLSRLAELSDLAVVVAIAVMSIVFATAVPEEGERAVSQQQLHNRSTMPHTSLWPAPDVTFMQGYGSLSSFVFAFQGHSIFVEIMAQMVVPSQFRACAYTANSTMGLVYIVTVAVAYSFVGDNVQGFLPFSLPESHPTARALVGVLLCFHILVSYLLTAQPLTEHLHNSLGGSGSGSIGKTAGGWCCCGRSRSMAASVTHEALPTLEEAVADCCGTSDQEGDREGEGVGSAGSAASSHSGLWLLLTLMLLAFAFLVANAVPFFSDFQNIVGSAIGAPVLFGWPPLLFLAAERKNGDPLSMLYRHGDPRLERVRAWDKAACAFFLCVMLPSCFALGLYSAVQSLAADWESFGQPFDCRLQGH